MASLIYRSLFLYRFSMNLLYSGSYRARLRATKEVITGSSCLELCFGDTLLAQWCQRKNISWIGMDINNYFVNCAVKKGFDAKVIDLNQIKILPETDVCVMAGSLYHFHQDPISLLKKMTNAAPLVIICEPVKNLSSWKGPLGWLARRSATTSAGENTFRYTRESFLDLMISVATVTGRHLTIESEFKKDITISLQ